MTKPTSTSLAVIDGRPVLVDENGRPVPDSMPVHTTAGEMAAAIASHAVHALQAGYTRGVTEGAEAGVKASAATINQTAQTYAQAGADAAAAHIASVSRVYKVIDRDPSGRIVSTHDELQPLPAIDPSESEAPYRRAARVGFRPDRKDPA